MFNNSNKQINNNFISFIQKLQGNQGDHIETKRVKKKEDATKVVSKGAKKVQIFKGYHDEKVPRRQGVEPEEPHQIEPLRQPPHFFPTHNIASKEVKICCPEFLEVESTMV